jgi:hypothetical protein
MSEQIDEKKAMMLEKQNEILKCLEGVNATDCRLILSSVSNEIQNVAFVKTNN